jgi:hypothetical protein
MGARTFIDVCLAILILCAGVIIGGVIVGAALLGILP